MSKDAKAAQGVADQMNAAVPSEHAAQCNAIRSAVIDRYDARVKDEVSFVLTQGKDTAALIDLNLGMAKDSVMAKDFRAQSTAWIRDRILERTGDAVSPDEWVASYHLHRLAKELTPSADSSRVSARFLRVVRACLERTLVSQETGYREEWSIKSGMAQIVKDAFDQQAREPLDREKLREWLDTRAAEVEQARIDAMQDGSIKTKLQERLDARTAKTKTAKDKDTLDLSDASKWTAADAEKLADAIVKAGNFTAAGALSRKLTPFLMSLLGPAAPVATPAPATIPMAEVRKIA